MRKLRMILLSTIILLSLISLGGCENKKAITVSVSEDDDLNGNVFGKEALIEIGNYLYYDATTRIVYWWNDYFSGNCATTPTPYYAPNGLPYRYNPETGAFEEIKED